MFFTVKFKLKIGYFNININLPLVNTNRKKTFFMNSDCFCLIGHQHEEDTDKYYYLRQS